MLPGILVSTWNLIKSSRTPGRCQVGWSLGFELSHTSSSASQWETGPKGAERVPAITELYEFSSFLYQGGEQMFSAFPSLFHIYNQKSVPTIFFFFFSNRASLPITLVSCAKLLTPHGVSWVTTEGGIQITPC